MLASVLKSPKARKMNIAIVRAFIALRKLIMDNRKIIEQLKELIDRIGGHEAQLNKIYEAIDYLVKSLPSSNVVTICCIYDLLAASGACISDFLAYSSAVL